MPPPHAKVKEVEEKFVASVGKDLSIMNLADDFPYRPNYGTVGTPLTVFANFFQVDIPPKLVLAHYAIITPPDLATKTGKRRDIVQAALTRLPNWQQLQSKIATDFATNLVTIGPIDGIDQAPMDNIDGLTAPTLTVRVPDLAEDGSVLQPASGRQQTIFEIKFRPLKHHNLQQILMHLRNHQGPRIDYEEKYETIQALNIFLGHYARASEDIFLKSSSTRNKMWHVKTERQDIGRGLEAVKGFFSSVRYATGRILLNVNNASIAAYKPLSLLDLMMAYRSTGKADNNDVTTFIKRVKIRRTWLKNGSSKEKTVWGLAKPGDGTPEKVKVRMFGAGPLDVQFRNNQGNWITVFDHFRTTYNITIGNTRAPVINIGSKENPSYVPAELCKVMDGQDYRLKLDGEQTSAMLKFAVNQPWFNFTYIEHRAPPVLGLNSALLRDAGINIQAKMITVQARILPPPRVSYALGKFAQVREGGWNMGDLKVITPGRAPSNWKFVFIHGTGPNTNVLLETRNGVPVMRDTAMSFVKSFSNELGKIGILGVTPPTTAIANLAFGASEMEFDSSVEQMFQANNAPFLFIALPKKLPDWQYKRIKYYGDIKFGVHTSCIAIDKMNGQVGTPGWPQYCANVGLKVNAKLGGGNQGPDPSKLAFLAKGKTMLVGLDVTHPAPGAKRAAESVAAMIANIDGRLGQWPAHLELNGQRVEEVSTIEKMLCSRLDLWKSKGGNKTLPENIMFFRDGVSEGQFQRVLQLELPQIRRAITRMYSTGNMPRLFIAVCGKRHNVRFAPSASKDCDRGNNCNPGLVVDSGITETRVWDFYLQAHKAIQGTARSCHYTVLHDEIFSNPKTVAEFGKGANPNKADLLQEMCNALAYTYPRATKAVSLSTPAKLADLACDRARAYLAKFIDSGAVDDSSSVASAAQNEQAAAIAIHPRLRDSMFYI